MNKKKYIYILIFLNQNNLIPSSGASSTSSAGSTSSSQTTSAPTPSSGWWNKLMHPFEARRILREEVAAEYAALQQEAAADNAANAELASEALSWDNFYDPSEWLDLIQNNGALVGAFFIAHSFGAFSLPGKAINFLKSKLSKGAAEKAVDSTEGAGGKIKAEEGKIKANEAEKLNQEKSTNKANDPVEPIKPVNNSGEVNKLIEEG